MAWLKLEPIFKPEYHAIWIDVTTPETRLNPGYKNEGELKAIDMVLKALQQSEGFDEFMKAQKKPEDKEIGIITFYSAQSREISANIRIVVIEWMSSTDSKVWSVTLLLYQLSEAMLRITLVLQKR